MVFRDISAPRACPVSSLVEGPTGRVGHMDSHEVAVEVSEAPWVAELPLQVIHAECDKLWLEAVPHGAKVGAVQQHRLLGTLPEIFHAFGEEWGKRWHKHAELDSSAWHAALQQIALVLPCVPPMELVEITPEKWQCGHG